MCGACGRLFVAAVMIGLLAVIRAFAAGGETEVLGVAGDLVPDSICVGPDGKRFAAVVVDPVTNKRQVIENCRNLGKEYDLVAQGTPIFSPDGGRIAFVAARGGKCFVVVDGIEGTGYEIVQDRWPIADLVLSRSGQHIAYKTRKNARNYLVVDGQEFGPYDLSLIHI